MNEAGYSGKEKWSPVTIPKTGRIRKAIRVGKLNFEV